MAAVIINPACSSRPPPATALESSQSRPYLASLADEPMGAFAPAFFPQTLQSGSHEPTSATSIIPDASARDYREAGVIPTPPSGQMPIPTVPLEAPLRVETTHHMLAKQLAASPRLQSRPGAYSYMLPFSQIVANWA
ncbi:unnamed protein product [Protopolystoma xenopodis]|uniref:Uncharacterized protein n=1 Tax=Protopolystoma xenopodis TaxID=117903 RepID=A0A448XNM8_9PLAT|nr:unnamed protein product [Protopolystoma xenopodis]